jgi:hypothetical protein
MWFDTEREREMRRQSSNDAFVRGQVEGCGEWIQKAYFVALI